MYLKFEVINAVYNCSRTSILLYSIFFKLRGTYHLPSSSLVTPTCWFSLTCLQVHANLNISSTVSQHFKNNFILGSCALKWMSSSFSKVGSICHVLTQSLSLSISSWTLFTSSSVLSIPKLYHVITKLGNGTFGSLSQINALVYSGINYWQWSPWDHYYVLVRYFSRRVCKPEVKMLFCNNDIAMLYFLIL